MRFVELDIKGVWLIEPQRYGDSRGYFMESYKQEEFDRTIGPVRFVQDNESVSRYGVVRGLHYQKGEFAQAKLVRVSVGRVLDVAVDLRKNSPTFGRHVAVELSSESGLQLYVPRGFAHGFAVLSEEAQFQYKVDNAYHPEAEETIKADDATLVIDWKVAEADRIYSEKDLRGKTFAEADKF